MRQIGFIVATLLAVACGVSGRGGNHLAGDGGVGSDDGGGMPPGDMAVPATATVVVAPGTPANAPSLFGGAADSSIAPSLVYPPDGALVPPNLNVLEIQWQPSSASLFELSFVGPGVNLAIYTVCQPVGGGCALTPDTATWTLLSSAARGGTVTVTVRGTGANGGGVGRSPSQKLSFADEDMQGGLYYWAAASGGIYRYDFGLRGKTAESFYTPQQAGGVMCVGCHALSRNGKRIAVGLNAPTPAPTLRLVEVSSRKTLFDQGGGFSSGGSNFEALTPDGTKVITTETTGLTVRDAQSGALIGPSPAVDNATMPDVSPDGSQVAFIRDSQGGGMPCFMQPCSGPLSTTAGGIFIASLSGATFGSVKELAGMGGTNFYYPSFSPDGKYLVFNASKMSSYDATDARVMVIRAAGGGPIDLAAVNALPGNSWPKWSPFMQHFRGASIFWITFSSRRSYGLRQPSATQIWMVPVDESKLAQGVDPGYPAFWLPFQDFATGNHIPQWVESVERAPCSSVDQSGCMANEMCVNGQCVPGPS